MCDMRVTASRAIQILPLFTPIAISISLFSPALPCGTEPKRSRERTNGVYIRKRPARKSLRQREIVYLERKILFPGSVFEDARQYNPYWLFISSILSSDLIVFAMADKLALRGVPSVNIK